jgi:hypothetical protein
MTLESILMAAAVVCVGVGNLALFRMLDAVNVHRPAQDKLRIRILSFNLNATWVYREYRQLYPDRIEWKVFVGSFIVLPLLMLAIALVHLFWQ